MSMHPITEVWNEKAQWFRDQAQSDRVAGILIGRLADDRVQDECRYLSRLRWHFFMGYEEVSYQQLLEHISGPKLVVLNELFSAIADRDHDEIDAWLNRCEAAFPIIHDRWRDQFGPSPEGDETVEVTPPNRLGAHSPVGRLSR